MANTIQVKRGANASLPTLNAGEFGFSTDTDQVYIGDGVDNHEIALKSGVDGISNSIDLEVSAATTSLEVGDELSDSRHELIMMTGSGVSTLTTITNGTHRQIKVIVFQDGNISLTDSDTQANGTFYLNQLPSDQDFSPQESDVIALVNINGDPGVTNGYWKELYRTVFVK